MALQGTLDTFDLAEVVALISGTVKSGQLDVRGDHASGEVLFSEGCVAGASLTGLGSRDPQYVLFELLRNSEGTYEFKIGTVQADATVDAEEVLAAAQDLMAEWAKVAEVVPGGHVLVRLNPSPGHEQVTMPARAWALVCEVGSGRTVSEIAQAMGVDEFQGCVLVKAAVELGIVHVEDPHAMAGSGPAVAPGEEPSESSSAPFAIAAEQRQVVTEPVAPTVTGSVGGWPGASAVGADALARLHSAPQ